MHAPTPRLICRAPVLLGALLLAHASLWAQTQDALTIPRVDRAPRLEDFLPGRAGSASAINGPLGNGAPGGAVGVTEFRQREPGDGVAVSQPTTAYLSYDDANLYVVFVCIDDPARVRANVARREEIDEDDQVVLYLDTFRDRERAYLFAANPLGIQLDGIRTEGQDEDMSFDAVWSSEGRLTDEGYVVRMTIPFRSLRFGNAPEQTWGVALGRVIRRNNEESYWPYITERVKGFVPQFAALTGLNRISPGRNVQLNPYSVLARAREFDDDIPAYLTDREERVGIDAKLVLRDAFTLDATVNPDFSQVESDDPQVTSNRRFEVFFPEKRPFFLENAGYFQTPVNLLFSRRIVDPGAGLRLSGKAGRWAIGALAMNDREPGRLEPGHPLAGREAGVGALRVQRELGEESTIGLLVTGREFGRSFSRAYSLDGRLRMGDNWSLSGQFIGTEAREPAEGDSIVTGRGGLAQLGYDGRHFEYSGSYVAFTPDFYVPLGFVERVAMREMTHEWQLTVRPEESALTAFGPTLAVLYNWDPTGRIQDRQIEAQFQIELTGETEIEFSRSEVFELFDGIGFRPHVNGVDVSTAWLKWLALSGTYEWGTAVNHDPAEGVTPFLGRASEVEVGVTIRPTPRLRFEQLWAQGTMRTGSRRVFTERELRSRVNYQFNRFLSLRAIVDYQHEVADTTLFDDDSRDQEWGVDLLLTYLVNPGTALHVGYTDYYENLRMVGTPPSVIRTRRPELSVGRQVFVKLSYLWRF